MSTYNGERYLKEQLQSIADQTYRNIDVWIRDDGSKDKTVSIIREFENKAFSGVRFHLLRDSYGNLGPGKSFYQATIQSGDADYYAYSDQDDVWMPEKIERAVSFLEKIPEKECALYAAGYDSCDAGLHYLKQGRKPEAFEKLNVGRAFYNYGAGLGQGFTLAFNRALAETAFVKDRDEIRGHDVWLWAVISGVKGHYFYDDYSSTRYRRHEGTVTVTGKGKINLWKKRYAQFRNVGYFRRISRGIQTYRELFGNQMTREEDIRFLKTFGYYDNFGKKRLRKGFYPYRLKLTWPEEIATRVAFLLGRA